MARVATLIWVQSDLGALCDKLIARLRPTPKLGDPGGNVRKAEILVGLLAATILASPAHAQQPSVADLMRRLDALQKEVDELKAERRAASRPTSHAVKTAHAPAASPSKNAAAPAAAGSATPAVAALQQEVAKLEEASAPVPGLAPPEPMGNQYEDEDALQSDLPGLSLRIPGSATELRFYGFAKLSGSKDFNSRLQTDAPSAQSIPLVNSPAWRQGGEFFMSARYSRLGVDTRSLTAWGTLETRLEGDFAGSTLTAPNSLFRLRQAWAELGTPEFRVLAGQANSLWNEGLFESVNDGTSLNQSFVRQAQLRATGTLAPGLTGQVSLEAPATQYTSVDGVFTPDTTFSGATPSFSNAPDLLGRLTYRYDGFEFVTRGLLRELSIRTAGTAFEPQSVSDNAVGWGLASHARMPMRWLSDAFGADEVTGMAFYGKGIGRYNQVSTFGQDAISNIGLPGVASASLDPLETYGFTGVYRRFWTTQLRSNVEYSYVRQVYPSYSLGFIPGSTAAIFLNSNIQQVLANLIWSPFASFNNGVFGSGWLDVALEYLYTQRGVFGGGAATWPTGAGYGVSNRVLGAVTARF